MFVVLPRSDILLNFSSNSLKGAHVNLPEMIGLTLIPIVVAAVLACLVFSRKDY